MSEVALSRPGLLVSVRSVEEALAALDGGADLIDVKEPSRGSLGRADDATLAAIVQAVAGRKPISAALGDLDSVPTPRLRLSLDLTYCKWGFAGWAHSDWVATLLRTAQALLACPDWRQRTVAVAYADHERASSPVPEDICAAAVEEHFGALLLDSHGKDGRTLQDWLPLERIAALAATCRQGGVALALAGSLGMEQIRSLRGIQPDWFAVRGAACRQGRRDARVDSERVRGLKSLLAETHM